MKYTQVLFILFILNFSVVHAPVVYSAEQIYGWQIMSESERNQYRQDIKNLTTNWERSRYRLQHHKKMLLHARKYGISLSDKDSHNIK